MSFFGTLGKWLGTAAGGVVAGIGGDIVGGILQNKSNNKALDAQSAANTQTLNFLRQQDARDFQEYLKERDRDWRLQEEDRSRSEEMRQIALQKDREREGRLAPFREGAANGYKQLSSLLRMPNGLRMPPPVSSAARPVNLADLVRM